MGPEQIRAELERVLEFDDMMSSRQMSCFLTFVVEETLAGRPARLKERTIALGALDRADDFDPRFDAIVRIVAGKLRRTLERYYHSVGTSNELRITIPKGGYVPKVLTRDEAIRAEPVASPSPQADPILRTKLHRPPVPPDLVRLPALIERLNRHRDLPLTLVSAPAGYGKSTLMSAWLDECDGSGAWLSLDPDDNGLRGFVGGLIAAVQTVAPTAADATRALLTAPELPAPRVLGRQLLNDLSEIDETFVLVLDDYHVIQAQEVHDLVAELLQHPLRNMHLVILTRQDPPLFLDRLRGRGQMEQLSMFDLRFTRAETADFLANTLEMALPEDVGQAIAERMEGWPAGLRLLAQSLRHREDPRTALGRLEGDLKSVSGYLVSEVLAQLPPETATCMLKISIADRFCESLGETICEEEGGAGQSERQGHTLMTWLRERNLFLIVLDAEDRWFRFHHLFQELLQEELSRRFTADEIVTLHARASVWFEDHGMIEPAIEHALAARADQRAAEIVERHRHVAYDDDRWFLVDGWLDLLPADLIEQRPALLLARAWSMQERFRIESISPLLGRIESLLGDGSADDAVVGELGFFRGYMRYFAGNAEEAREMMEEAKRRCPGEHQMIASEIELHLALARQASGQGEAAVQAVEASIRAADPKASVLLSRLAAASVFVELLSGDLGSALGAARRFRSVTGKADMSYARAWSYYLEGIPLLHRHELGEAARLFELTAASRAIMHRQAAVDAMAGLALAYEFLGRSDVATDALEQLFQFARDTENPDHVTVAESCRARLALLRGDSGAALGWARRFHADADAPSMFLWLESPVLTKARVLITAGSEKHLNQASESLASLRQGIEAMHFTCQAIEIAVLQAVALEKLGQDDDALAALKQALTLAEPGGWVRPFAEAGPPMTELLNRIADQHRDHAYAKGLLAALDEHTRATATARNE